MAAKPNYLPLALPPCRPSSTKKPTDIFIKLDHIQSFPHFKASNGYSLQMEWNSQSYITSSFCLPFWTPLPSMFPLLCSNQVRFELFSVEDRHCWCPASVCPAAEGFSAYWQFPVSRTCVSLLVCPEAFSSSGVCLTTQVQRGSAGELTPWG